MAEPERVVRREIYDSQHTLTWGTDTAKTTALADCSCGAWSGVASLDDQADCIGMSRRADAHITEACSPRAARACASPPALAAAAAELMRSIDAL